MDRLRSTFADDLAKLIRVRELGLDANDDALDKAILAMISFAAIGLQWQAGLRGPGDDLDVAVAMFKAGIVATEEKRRAAERDRGGGTR